MSKISEEVEKFLSPIVEELGCEIVEVEFAKKYNGDNLTMFIDKKGGVTIEDCEKVHSAIDEPLDELNPTQDRPYTLNVSSPGIDRPIVTDKDYNRNIGEVLEVKLFQAIDKKKVFVGTKKTKVYIIINSDEWWGATAQLYHIKYKKYRFKKWAWWCI